MARLKNARRKRKSAKNDVRTRVEELKEVYDGWNIFKDNALEQIDHANNEFLQYKKEVRIYFIIF